MKSISWKRFTNQIFAALLLQSISALGAESPLRLSASFNVTIDGRDKTFFELMSGEGGIKKVLDVQYTSSVKIADLRTFRSKASNFSHLPELESKLIAGGLDQLIQSLADQEIPITRLYAKVIKAINDNNLMNPSSTRNASRLAGALVPIIGLASGTGALVQLDSENYVYNYGYAVGTGGTDPTADETAKNSGRSYGASIERNAYDPSDNDYLKELGIYASASSEAELKKFYTAIFRLLLKNESSGIQALSRQGQTVFADFMAIYMAELDRHLMSGLKKYEWENALTEITMLAAYSAAENGVTLDYRGGVSNNNNRSWVASSDLPAETRMIGFFGVGTQGSGLDGRNKERRHALTKKIVSEQRRLNPEGVAKIQNLIGANRDVDVYDETMNTVNNFDTQTRIKENADELADALVSFILNTKSTAASMNILE